MHALVNVVVSLALIAFVGFLLRDRNDGMPESRERLLSSLCFVGLLAAGVVQASYGSPWGLYVLLVVGVTYAGARRLTRQGASST